MCRNVWKPAHGTPASWAAGTSASRRRLDWSNAARTRWEDEVGRARPLGRSARRGARDERGAERHVAAAVLRLRRPLTPLT